MIAVFKNNVRRLLAQKQLFLLIVIFTTVAVAAAIFVSTKVTTSYDIAVVHGDAAHEKDLAADSTTFTYLKEAPGMSDLVSGKYDGILHIDAAGNATLQTIKSEEAEAQMLALLSGEKAPEAQFSGRGIGTNVLGYVMMFILLMGSMAMSLYGDDRSGEQLSRVAASPVSISSYLFAHGLSNTLFLFLPTSVIMLFAQALSGVDFGFSIPVLLVLLFIICAFATAFSMLLYSLISNKVDSARMTGNTLIIITSILAGSFYAFEQGNGLLGAVIKVLPQKAYLTLANGLEQGAAVGTYLGAAIYLGAVIIGFYLISVAAAKRAYVEKR